MKRKGKRALVILFSMLLAAASFTSFTDVVSAEDSKSDKDPKKKDYVKDYSDEDLYELDDEDMEGIGVHADPATFEKNFDLSVAQKAYTITEIEKIVSKITKPEMSDLEKYYRLAVWENKRAKYDWHFWSGRYYFDLYRHQWDSYGVLTEKSVCVGMAITYATLCHAADLPCKFVRTDPKVVDHTVNYIPDINGNAYCVDVTENSLFMSKYADDYFVIDKDFAYITKDCTDGSFEYNVTYDGWSDDDGVQYSSIRATNIKDCYNLSFDDWFKEYALHEVSSDEKDFRTQYTEKGSGLPATDPGYYHASYRDYPKQFSATEKPDVWFLEDFYRDPQGARRKILNKELDEQFLNISGIKESYDCDSIEDLTADIEDDIAIQYFPSSENGEVVAWADDLKNRMDYTIQYESYDASTGEAIFAIRGAGDYVGTYLMRVKLNDINNADVVLSQNAFKYNGKVQKPSIRTIKGVTLTEGKDYIASWSNTQSKDAGTYSVTIEGKGIFSGTAKATYVIGKADNPVTFKAKTAKVKYAKLKNDPQTIKRAKVIKANNAKGALSYKLVSAKRGNTICTKNFSVDAKTGNVTLKKGLEKGTYKVKVIVKAGGNTNYNGSVWKKVTFTIKVK